MSDSPSHPLARRLQVRERGAWRTIQLPPQEIFVGRSAAGLGARVRADPDVLLSLRPTLEGILVTPAAPGAASVNGEPLSGPRLLGKYDLLEIADALLRTSDGSDEQVPSEDWTSAETVVSEDGLNLAAPALPKLGEGLFAGRYTLHKILGQGGFGAVYQAWDTQLQRAVAIKVLVRAEGRSLQRFAMEIRATAALRHPNLVTVFDSGIEGERPYLVMELIEGQTLEALAGKGLSPSRAAAILQEITTALSYAHQQGLLHRDIKPQNMMVGPGGRSVLLDFGLVRVARSAEDEMSRITREGTRLGTLPYMSPEQAFAADIDERSEVYSLGASLYHALTGHYPFHDAGNEIVVAIASRDPVRPSALREGIPPDLEAICRKAMEKRAPDRYPTAAELSADLARFLAGEPTRARPLTAGQRLARRLRRDRQTQLLTGGVLLLLSLLGGGAWVVSTQRAAIEEAQDQLAHGEAEERARLVREAEEELRQREAEEERQRAKDALVEELRETLDAVEEEPNTADPQAVVRACLRAGPEVAVPMLSGRLAALARRLLEHEARLYAAGNALQPGETTLPGLEEAIAARTAGPGHVHTASEAETLRAVQLRLRKRSKGELRRLPTISAVMTSSQEEEIPPGEFKLASLACQALRQLSPDEAFDALALYMHAEWDPLRAAEAGLTLSAIDRPEVLDHLLASYHRLGAGSLFARRLREQLAERAADADQPPAKTAAGWLDRARFHAAVSDTDAALAAADRAIALDPELDDAYLLRSVAKLRKGDLTGSRADLDEAIKLLPIASELWSNRSNVRLMQGDVQGALADATQALKLNPRSPLAGFNLAQALKTAGRLQQALTSYTRVLQLDPTYGAAWAERAELRRRAGDTSGALSDCAEAIRLDPRDASAWATQASVQYDRGEHRAALESVTRAVDLEPERFIHRANRGLYQTRLGNVPAAFADFDAGVRMATRPEDVSSLLARRASAHLGLGQRTKALKDLERALELSQNNVTALRLRASINSQRGKWAKTTTDLRQLSQLTPKDAGTWAMLADALYRQKKLEQGDEALARAYSLAPTSPAVLQTRALRLQLGGKHEEALNVYDQLIELSPQSALARRLRGFVHERLGHRQEAIADYEAYLRMSPSSSEAPKVREALKRLR